MSSSKRDPQKKTRGCGRLRGRVFTSEQIAVGARYAAVCKSSETFAEKCARCLEMFIFAEMCARVLQFLTFAEKCVHFSQISTFPRCVYLAFLNDLVVTILLLQCN